MPSTSSATLHIIYQGCISGPRAGCLHSPCAAANGRLLCPLAPSLSADPRGLFQGPARSVNKAGRLSRAVLSIDRVFLRLDAELALSWRLHWLFSACLVTALPVRREVHCTYIHTSKSPQTAAILPVHASAIARLVDAFYSSAP
jgi:hypothetical protein